MVTVNCDYHAVSQHAIRIVDFIYKVSKFGGARIATIAGILSTGTRKTRWWIPTDQYALKYGANEVANITPDLWFTFLVFYCLFYTVLSQKFIGVKSGIMMCVSTLCLNSLTPIGGHDRPLFDKLLC